MIKTQKEKHNQNWQEIEQIYEEESIEPSQEEIDRAIDEYLESVGL